MADSSAAPGTGPTTSDDLLRQADHETRVVVFRSALLQLQAMMEAGWDRTEAIHFLAVYYAALARASGQERKGDGQ